MKPNQLNPLRTFALAALAVTTSTLLQAAPAVSVSSGTVAPNQATDDPYNMTLAGPVMQAGSTAESKSFDTTVMPGLLQAIKQYLPEGQNNTGSKAFEIDPSKLKVASTHDITATFVYENAGYHNAIGFDAVAPSQKGPQSAFDEVTSPTARLIFPDASTPAGGGAAIGSGATTPSQPVVPGDFVDLGTIKAGTGLDFFLLSNGANNNSPDIFSTQESLNKDGFQQHVAEFSTKLFAVPQLNSPYIFLSFEDLYGGGDRDINDTIIAVNVGAATVKSLLATPEPAMPLTFTACLGLALFAVRKNRKAAATV